MIRAAVAVLSLVVALGVAEAGTARDPQRVRDFRKTHPCPHTGLTTGPCPGYGAGGEDAPRNMMWQEYQASLVKDRLERELCACQGQH